MNAVATAVKLLYWIAGRITDNPHLSAECYRVARELEEVERIRAGFHSPGQCRRCGGEIVNANRGRRRLYCRECRPTITSEMGEKFAGLEG